ncbi:thiosulfate oxidation carrier protein SoxY [uncultured Roseibium sp.]|uniref:thiosulfate oxidation carrier protein SoxY n=1 Tax=uncultured Roseibium sp. TaxID=1936171 RepID=UPI0037483878
MKIRCRCRRNLSLPAPLADFEFAATMRVNGPTPVHAVAELENGQLFMAESFIKTSGQAPVRHLQAPTRSWRLRPWDRWNSSSGR